jgi:hypothetical protein
MKVTNISGREMTAEALHEIENRINKIELQHFLVDTQTKMKKFSDQNGDATWLIKCLSVTQRHECIEEVASQPCRMQCHQPKDVF